MRAAEREGPGDGAYLGGSSGRPSGRGAPAEVAAPRVVVGILGPTAVGKTTLAIALAGLLGTRVISCDSMQVYRGFPALTGGPSPEELSLAPHELVGTVDPREDFSAVEYARRAAPLIEEDLARHGAALVVGGTGLYMRAVLAPLAVRPASDRELRTALEDRAAAEGPAALHKELARRDPAAAAAIDPRNVRRVVRALETVMTTGSAWSDRGDLWRPGYERPTLLTALMLDREELYRRIDLRARRIVEGGAVDEVARFREAAPAVAGAASGGANTAARPRRGITAAIGFAEISDYLDGRETLDATVRRVAAATRRYARRQITWLRKVQGLVIIDVQGREAGDVAEEILALMSSAERIKEPERP